MQKGNLTREQAVAIVGEAAVSKAEATNCEPTNRVGYNGACQGDAEIEWSGSASVEDKDGTDCTVTAYYYTSQEEINEAGDDLSNVNWTIAGYEVV